jgi:hypothetical protein
MFWFFFSASGADSSIVVVFDASVKGYFGLAGILVADARTRVRRYSEGPESGHSRFLQPFYTFRRQLQLTVVKLLPFNHKSPHSLDSKVLQYEYRQRPLHDSRAPSANFH